MTGDAAAPAHTRAVRSPGVTWLLIVATGGVMVWWLLWLRGRPDVDMWLHLRIGESLRDGTRFQTVPDPLVAIADRPYVPTQWLAEILGYSVHQTAGLVGVHALRYACIVLLIAAVYASARVWVSATLSAAVTLPVVFCTSAAWGERPQLAGVAVGALTVAMWSRSLGGGRTPLLLVPLTWVWAMLHGSWVIGIAFGVLFIVAMAIERPSRPRRWSQIAVVPLAQGVAAALTPLGPSLLLEPLRVGAAARAGVNEWQTPSASNPLLIAVVLMAVVVFARSARSLLTHLPELLLAAAAVGLSVWSVRTVAFGALLLAPALAMVTTSRQRSSSRVTIGERWSAVAIFVALALVPGVVWGAPSVGPLSTAADAALNALPPGTRVAVEPYSSGWVLWAHPTLTVVRDLRAEVYSKDTARSYESFARAEPGWQDYAARHRIGSIVAASGSTLDRALALERGWNASARDTERAVWIRGS